MKLLLTSSGLTNKSIAKALLDLAGKPFNELNLVFIPTAANVVEGDKDFLIKNLINCRNLGFASIDIVDISAIPRDIWEPRIKEANILLFGGGDPYHLMHWIQESGLKEILPRLLTNRVYVGSSAGSIVATHSLFTATLDPKEYKDEQALSFVNFHISPHFNSPLMSSITKEYLEKIANELHEPFYAIDDQTAIKVVNGKIEIISEGEYLEFNV